MGAVTQTDRVLALLREHPYGITQLQALSEVGTMRLAARVKELRDRGFVIRTDRFTTATHKVVARYRLEEQTELGL